MIDAKSLFDRIRVIKGKPLTQQEVNDVNAILAPAGASPSPTPALALPPHPHLMPDIIMAAQRSELKWKIPTSVTLAQFALESAWGKKMPPNSFNPFGIKARIRDGKIIDPYVTANTDEQNFNGQAQWRGPQPFRKFKSFDEAFDAHGELLGSAGVYAKARAKLPDPDAFADALTGVYATARNYGSALKSLMQSSGLYKYNLTGRQS
ncbi:glycoside hydrolase family 73 protein [Sphingomonas sp.]|uniref:glycoside hydrolase family 73 protein n=1 Tax=Sphingomonas sp. TaxID=28214 RepID=UPI003B3B8F25